MMRIRHLLNLATSLLFMVAILVPSLILLTTPDQEISEAEQRTLTQLPENTNPFNQQFSEFVASFEAYTTDQFGYRDRLIYWHNYLKVVYMHKSSTEKVAIGKDKWLFYTVPNQIEDHQGLSELSEDDLAAWASLLNYRHEWLAERGIPYVLVIAPDKKSIYPEYYPAQYPIINKNNTQLDQLLAYMSEHSELVILDLREPLLAYKRANAEGELLYYTADTHWTQTGAWVAYQWMMSQIQKFTPQLGPVNNDALILIPLEKPLQGNLLIMGLADLAEFWTQNYHIICYIDAGECNKPSETGDCHEIDYEYAYLASIARIYKCNSKSVNALIFHDSFGLALYSHFIRTFETSVLIRRTERFWLISEAFEILLNDTQPDIIIEEMVERTFTDPPHPSRIPPVSR